jgi:hypothetical protein
MYRQDKKYKNKIVENADEIIFETDQSQENKV